MWSITLKVGWFCKKFGAHPFLLKVKYPLPPPNINLSFPIGFLILQTVIILILLSRCWKYQYLTLFRLELWPGYDTSIHKYDAGVLLNLDVSHKVMRTNNVLAILYELYSSVGERNFYNVATKKLVGEIVITRYLFIKVSYSHTQSFLFSSLYFWCFCIGIVLRLEGLSVLRHVTYSLYWSTSR